MNANKKNDVVMCEVIQHYLITCQHYFLNKKSCKNNLNLIVLKLTQRG
jgi:hypothetical protein